MILKFTGRVEKILTGSISALPPHPRASGRWGLSPQTPRPPKQPPIANFWLRA